MKTTVPESHVPATRERERPQCAVSGRSRSRLAVRALPAALVILVSLGRCTPAAGQNGDELFQDFRGGKPLHPSLRWTGTDGDDLIAPDERGLRIKLTADSKRKDAVGVLLAVPVKGNFEVTAGYELIDVNPPTTGNGVGFELYVMTRTPTQEAIAFSRVKRADASDVFSCTRATTVEGRRRYQSNQFPAAARSGQLRLSRSGGEAVLSAAEEGGAFQELCRFDLGVEDLKMVRVGAYPGNVAAPVEVRLLDLKVRSEQPMPGLAADLNPTTEGSPAVPRRWLVVVEVLGVIVLLALGALGAWVYLRRRRAAEPAAEAPEDPPPAAATPSAVVAFLCTGCGKTMRARASLAGKKGKCAHCGTPVLVPGDGATSTDIKRG